jgi:hypothetical protein
LDVAQRPVQLSGFGGIAGGLGLYRDSADVVGDQVVQLAGDAGTFGGDRGGGLVAPVPLRSRGALFQRHGVGPPGSQMVADQQGQQERTSGKEKRE